MLAASKERGFHTVLETSGLTTWERLSELRPLVDLFLVDVKHIDSARHKQLTGVGNEAIVGNIRRMSADQWPMHLRIPWVPMYNADETFLQGLLDLLAELRSPPLVVFLPYHRLGIGKWSGLGLEPPMPQDVPDADWEDLRIWTNRLQSAGFQATIS